MRVHALEATGGYTYAQMGQFEAKPDTPKASCRRVEARATNSSPRSTETGKLAENGAREVWVTETALSTALNASYMADRLSLFGIVVGIALLLTGIGFLVLVAGGAVRNPDTVIGFLRRHRPNAGSRG